LLLDFFYKSKKQKKKKKCFFNLKKKQFKNEINDCSEEDKNTGALSAILENRKYSQEKYFHDPKCKSSNQNMFLLLLSLLQSPTFTFMRSWFKRARSQQHLRMLHLVARKIFSC